MVQIAEDYRRYLDPSALARISRLDLRARRLAEGFIAGRHRSPTYGFSVEFAQHRKYAQGDDLRHIDWKVYGRTDKHYVKQFLQESNMQLLLAVDTSRSMSYRHDDSPMSKRDYAMTVAAAVAFIAVQQSDHVALAVFDSRLHRLGRPSNHPGKWKNVVLELAQRPEGGRTAFKAVLDELAETLHRRHLVVVISDLFGPADDILAGIKHLRHRHHEPIVLQVLDRAELTYPFQRPLRFLGLEDDGAMITEPRAMRRRYLARLEAFIRELRQGCRRQRTDFEVLDTSAPVNTALHTILAARAASMRRG
jgi:uncharacterized protein (DUF58 family)